MIGVDMVRGFAILISSTTKEIDMSIRINGEALAKFIDDEITDNRRIGASASSAVIAVYRDCVVRIEVIGAEDYCYDEGIDDCELEDIAIDGIAESK
ncbi:MAG: hypothetical protein ACRDD7_13645 [Peptostreptococcaceae bacterium]